MVRQFICGSSYSKEVFNFPGAVHERIEMHAHAIEQREVEIGQVGSLLVPNMPASLQASRGAARNEDRKVLMVVNAGIPHAASIDINRVIEKRTIAIGSGLHPLQKVRKQRNMECVDLRDLRQLFGVAAM